MFPRFQDRWLFGVCWNGAGGDNGGSSSDGPGSGGGPGPSTSGDQGTPGGDPSGGGGAAGSTATVGSDVGGIFGHMALGNEGTGAATSGGPAVGSHGTQGGGGASGGGTTGGGGVGGGSGAGTGGGAATGGGAGAGAGTGSVGGGGHGGGATTGPTLGQILSGLFGVNPAYGFNLGPAVDARGIGLGQTPRGSQGAPQGGQGFPSALSLFRGNQTALNNAMNVAIPSLLSLAQNTTTQAQPSPTLADLANMLGTSTNFGNNPATQQADQNAQIAAINDALSQLFGTPSVRGPGSDATTGPYGEPSNDLGTDLGFPSLPGFNPGENPSLVSPATPYGLLGSTLGGQPPGAQSPFGFPNIGATAVNAPSPPGTANATGIPGVPGLSTVAPGVDTPSVRSPGSEQNAPVSTTPNMGDPFGNVSLTGVNAPNPAINFGPQPSIRAPGSDVTTGPYGETTAPPATVVANPNLSPTQKATTIAHTLAKQTPAQQSHTISQAITTAQQTMTPPAYESFLNSLLGYYTPTTGNVRGPATYHAGR